jgi:cytochrome P450
MDSTTQFLFGEPMGCLAQATLPSTIVELINSFEMSMSCAYRRTALGPLSYLDRNYSAEAELQHVVTTRRFVDNMINEALIRYNENKSSKIEDTIAQHKSLFEILMETTSFPAMRDHLVTTFGAARDTTGTLLSQMWYEVSRHPDVFTKLKTEVGSVLQGQLPTADSLKKLPYMDQVMKETLRLWSPVPVTMRIANKV